MSNSLAGKIFTIYSILFCSFAISLFLGAFPYEPWFVGTILTVCFTIVILSIISLVMLFMKNNKERILMIIMFVLYVFGIIGFTIFLSIQSSFLSSFGIAPFYIIPIASGLFYFDKGKGESEDNV